MAQLFDKLFGTRYYTHGAELQLPRKVPMRVEPKSYFGKQTGDASQLVQCVFTTLLVWTMTYVRESRSMVL